MLCLLPLKPLKTTVFGRMVNIAAFLLILVKKTVIAFIPYIRMNVSLLLLKHTEPIGKPLSVCQVTTMTCKPLMLLCMNIIAGTIIIQHMNMNKGLFWTKITKLSTNKFGIMRAKIRQNLPYFKNLSIKLSSLVNRLRNFSFPLLFLPLLLLPLFPLPLLPLPLLQQVKSLSQTPQTDKNIQRQ